MHVGMALKPRSLWQLGKRNSEISFENLLSCDWLQTVFASKQYVLRLLVRLDSKLS